MLHNELKEKVKNKSDHAAQRMDVFLPTRGSGRPKLEKSWLAQPFDGFRNSLLHAPTINKMRDLSSYPAFMHLLRLSNILIVPITVLSHPLVLGAIKHRRSTTL